MNTKPTQTDIEQSEKPKLVKLGIAAQSMAEFLETTPPSSDAVVRDLIKTENRLTGTLYHLHTPDIRLICAHNDCGGVRTFRFSGGTIYFSEFEKSLDTFIEYTCSNCLQTTKQFSLIVSRGETGEGGQCYKYGERPPFGPPTPTRLLRMLGGDKDLFLKGRRCESQSLGVGAFSYYRRAVENQKNKIISEVKRVAEVVKADQQMIDDLEVAGKEIQFSKAIDKIKHGIPESLLINGQNPLTLLHTALSVGIHDMSDEECLEIAQEIRIILAEFADRLSQALKDEAELTNAVNKLMQRSKKKKK